MTKIISLLPLVLALSLTLAGCDTISEAASNADSAVSNVASALDPSDWFGSDTPSDADTAENGISTDTAANTTPDLANLPSRPATTPTAQSQAAAQSLAADGAQARYSADALRAGTEAAAAPPGAADMPPTTQMAMAAPSADAPPTTDIAPPSAGAAAPPLTTPPGAQPAVSPPPARPMAAAPPPAAMASAAPPPAALTQGTAAVPVPGAVQAAALPPPAGATASVPTTTAGPGVAATPVGSSASATPVGPSAASPVGPSAAVSARPPGAEPAVPPNTPVRSASAGGSRFASDAEVGFKPSQAPALNPSINQWVSAPVVARYRQTAAGAGVAPVRLAAVPPKGGAGEALSGAVSADFGGPVTTASASIAAMNGGIAPTAVVYFPTDGTALSKAARDQIRSAADHFKAGGGTGSIRVVGHASSRTSNMTVEKHLETIFKKSQDRANAVAQELIHQGVPAAKVLIDAVGDSQPVYYESMPRGEEGNRRAEIFVQG